MKKLLFGVFAVIPMVGFAQHPAEYIKWEGKNDEKFYDAYASWQPGQPLYSSNPEDENFFISRVRFKQRFRNTNTQVDKSITESNDKRVINWVPVGTSEGYKDNALPSAIYDSDVFSMWNYITYYGNWTCPFIRVPGAFMDVANKNGVGTSCIAGIGYGVPVTNNDDWGKLFKNLYSGGSEKLLKFLKYYGVGGYGYNSEQSWDPTILENMLTQNAEVYEKAITQEKYPQFNIAYYTFINGSDGLNSGNQEWYHHNGKPSANVVFTNYNWDAYKNAESERVAKNLGRNPLDVYCGMNMQGAEGKNWKDLATRNLSIGLWGAHNENMFFERRGENGSDPDIKQRTLLVTTERFFGNGVQNPAKKMEIVNALPTSLSGTAKFHGIARFSTAKSTLAWDLTKEDFYSYFNLGNGKFFNIKGETVNNNEWYNLSMQDYLPTWRYWFASSFLGTDVPQNGLSATFTWDDAWFGGSCLEISGSNASEEYLHLFKTKFALQEGDKITIRYKVVSGSGNFDLVASAEGSESTMKKVSVKNEDVLQDEWIEKVITVSASGRNNLQLAGSTMAVLGLKFSNAQNLKLLLGEVSVKRGAKEKPASPVINSQYTKTFKVSYKGVDGKLIFNMATPSANGTDPVYNDDVKTSFFKVYSQQEGVKEEFVCATTSWAALLFNAKYDTSKSGSKIRFGVSAVGLDGETESDIAWSEYMSVPQDLSIGNTFSINIPVIKSNQDFTIGFDDPNHDAGTWKIFKPGETNPIYTVSDVKSFTYRLPDVGLYDMELTSTYNGKQYTAKVPGYIQISEQSVGAVPQIKTLTFNGQNYDVKEVKTPVGTENNLAYTANPSNGTVSRGLDLKEKAFAIAPGNVGISDHHNWTLSFWVKFHKINGNIQLLNIRDTEDEWPRNNWGYIWSDYNPDTHRYFISLRGNLNYHPQENYDGIYFTPGVWTHIAYVYKHENGTHDIELYINGKKQTPEKRVFPVKDSDRSIWLPNNKIMLGGPAAFRGGMNAVIDNVKFWDKPLSEKEIAAKMFDKENKQTDEKGFWTFENEAGSEPYYELTSINEDTGIAEWGGFVAGRGEGVQIIKPEKPEYEGGSPFVVGNGFTVTTTPKWVFKKGTVTDGKGNDTAGSAKVTYKVDATVSGTLTLSNTWGKDSKTIQTIVVGTGTGIELTDELSLQAFPNPFVETLNIRFSDGGRYNATIYDLSGNIVDNKNLAVSAGEVFTINLNAPKGTYLLRITTEEGKLIRTVKLLKK